ncbi:uncharacterized protein CcaverHIS019_0505670 [Cutaneotrichosporon cavernicola]|uniref:Nucleic acid-binding protein n=1 Tax=Cutaneotrichosporon cavernicola TaxID=279322 RepID=A0AA48QWW7_9TREE|nr:uncharacterized protein CcaverHIS019_0505670 [Cutaneotrichosporon cavernicola]BEI92939.1 hypothetical protein CcaverHIS019_0505670 [Cutaneotrichosporon cavernicola]BEJ00715.1 hypothetical protein CcaverHIS631_0505720 [Cutaneotrichosporon cavernicola]BEJ08482.1 hypothetical protein CcaverHIS641_0505760 [Cutaneotrichosporon cavernicola]
MSHSLFGIVTKTGAMSKTVTVSVPRYFEHAKLLKRIHKETKMLVHDENETALLGDVVVIRHGKSFSKRKSFFIQSLDNRPDYPGLPEKSVYVGLATKNAKNLIEAQKAKAKRKEADEAAKLAKVDELIKKARL